MARTQELVEEAERQRAVIADQFAAEFGYGRTMLNPMAFTDTMYGNFVESGQDFLTRTLLTGSDIAEMSMDMVTEFASYSLRLDVRP
jgi:hypothetical protein